jgi:hypothetical protein
MDSTGEERAATRLERQEVGGCGAARGGEPVVAAVARRGSVAARRSSREEHVRRLRHGAAAEGRLRHADSGGTAVAWLSSGEERARARVATAVAYERRRGKTERLNRLKETQIRFSRGDRTRCSPDRTRCRGVRSESSKLLV